MKGEKLPINRVLAKPERNGRTTFAAEMATNVLSGGVDRTGLTNLWHAFPKGMMNNIQAGGLQCYPDIFITSFAPTGVSSLRKTRLYTHISDTVQTVHELPTLPNNTAMKLLYTHRSGVQC